MSNAIIQQGRFTADGNAKTLKIRSDVDWMRVVNFTIADANQTTAVGVEYFWQRGMAADTGIEYLKSSAANAANLTDAMASGGFTLVDSSAEPLGAATSISSATDATRPVVSTGSTSGLSNGDIVRMSSTTGQENLGGIDFQIDSVVTNTSFRVANTLATTPGAAMSAGFWRKVSFDPIYYPAHRVIVDISAASAAVVTTSVDHDYTVGQEIRMSVPAGSSMIEMDGLLGTVTAVSASTFTVDVDSSAFTAFTFPLPAEVPFTPALAVPVGIDVAQARSSSVDEFGDETDNISFVGMILAAGANSPAGENAEVIYWVAGKSFSIDNT